MYRAPILKAFGISLVDRVRRAERNESIMSDLRTMTPTGVDLFFVKRGAKEALKGVGNERARAQLEVRVFRLLNSVD